MDFDIFISHASEDKPTVVRPLVEQLKKMGLRVWYDEFELTIGDSLRRSLDKGLARSRYGVVVLSPDFLRKEWPNKEIDALVTREDGKEKVILPVWHNVTSNDVKNYSLLLADKLAISTESGIGSVAEGIFSAVNRDSTAPQNINIEITDPIATALMKIRRDVLSNPGREKLRRLLYEIEDLLHKAPTHIDAKVLRDQIQHAISSESSSSPIQRSVNPFKNVVYRPVFATLAAALIGVSLFLSQPSSEISSSVGDGKGSDTRPTSQQTDNLEKYRGCPGDILDGYHIPRGNHEMWFWHLNMTEGVAKIEKSDASVRGFVEMWCSQGMWYALIHDQNRSVSYECSATIVDNIITDGICRTNFNDITIDVTGTFKRSS
ncbi:MAG: toll/interleukin-1 receptor domain-containing protein [Candidatus Thiodiazotropha sp.]